MRRCASQMKPLSLALDKLIVIPAVKVMKSPQLYRGLFDLHGWHISNTTCHQSSPQPKELQLTFDPSTLLPWRKVGALNFGRLTAFFKRVFRGGGFWVTDIWDEKGVGGFCVNSLNCGPKLSLCCLLLQVSSLNIYKQSSTMATCLSVC